MSGTVVPAGHGGNGRARPEILVLVVPVTLRKCKAASLAIDTVGITVRPWEPVRGQA